MPTSGEIFQFVPRQNVRFINNKPTPARSTRPMAEKQLAQYDLEVSKAETTRDIEADLTEIEEAPSRSRVRQFISKKRRLIGLVALGSVLLIAVAAVAIPIVVTRSKTDTTVTTVTSTTSTTGTTATTTTSTSTTSTTTSTTSTSTSATTTTTITAVLSQGVQLNFNPASLSGGWSLCYSATFATVMSASDLVTILNACNKNNLLLGCRPVGNTVMTTAAMAARSSVLYNCGSTTSCSYLDNGVQWYYSNSYSWGYAQGGDSVTRNSCDTDSTNAAYRLCWHTQGSGGYRCGATLGLNSDTTWEKVIYHSN